jgi:hypothetical protein
MTPDEVAEYQLHILMWQSRLIAQMERVQNGEVSYRIAAAELGMIPSEFTACFVRAYRAAQVAE